jgi:hypothetical protein
LTSIQKKPQWHSAYVTSYKIHEWRGKCSFSRFAAKLGSKETHTDTVWTVADASQEASNSQNKKGKENL